MRRAVLGVASNAVSGAVTTGAQLVAAALLEPTEFALFAIAATTAIMGIGLTRCLVGQVDMIRGVPGRHEGPGDAAAAVALGFFISGTAVSAAGLWASERVLFMIGLGLASVAVSGLQDSLRFRSFRNERPQVALASDLAVAGAVVAGLVVLDDPSADSVLSIWIGATAVGHVLGSVLLRYHRFGPRAGLRWMTSHRDLVIPGTGEFVLQTGLPYALNFAILAVGGAEAFAGYRLAQLIFAAVGNLAVGLNAVSLPRLVGARRPRQALQDVRNEFWLLTGLVAVLTLVMFLIPLDLGREVFGANWVAMVPFLAACAVHGWANSVAVPVVALIRLLGLAMYSLWIRMGTVVATIVGVAAVASWGGPQAFAWALALPAVGGFLARFLRVRAELRRLVLEDRLIP